MDSSTYRQLLSQPSKSSAISHCKYPGHNLLSLDTLLEVSQNLNSDLIHDGPEFLSRFPCYESFPYAVQRSSVLFCGSRATDDATELLKNKMKWERKLKTLKVSNTESAIKWIKRLRQNKAVKLPKDLNVLFMHFLIDPLPNFSGNYNWLYTGGCLSYDQSYDGTTLIKGDFFNKRYGFHMLKLNETLNGIQYKCFTKLKAYTPVLQIACKAKQENLIVGVRQKNFINIFNIRKVGYDSRPVKLWTKKVRPAKVLTCIDLKANCEEIMISDNNFDLHIYNIERNEKILGHSGKKIAPDSKRDFWSQVAFEELGIYWAFKNCFAVLDQRDYFNPVTRLEFMPTTVTNNCEEICCFAKSPNDSNYVYLGTTHSVLQVDLRNVKAVQKWTHLMKHPPQFMAAVKVEDKNEVLVLQSQAVDEILGIVNHCSNDGEKVNFLSPSLPCLFKSIKESLNLAHFHGVCLSPVISKRVNFAVTGMQCLKNDQNDITLFIANSGGDIFESKIKKKTSERTSLMDQDKQEVLNAMRIYEAHWEKLAFGNSAQGHFELADMRHIVRGLGRTRRKAKNVKRRSKVETYWPYAEMYAPESLKWFKDLLAQKILKVWGHHSEDSETDCVDASVHLKVREWMDKN